MGILAILLRPIGPKNSSLKICSNLSNNMTTILISYAHIQHRPSWNINCPSGLKISHSSTLKFSNELKPRWSKPACIIQKCSQLLSVLISCLTPFPEAYNIYLIRDATLQTTCWMQLKRLDTLIWGVWHIWCMVMLQRPYAQSNCYVESEMNACFSQYKQIIADKDNGSRHDNVSG